MEFREKELTRWMQLVREYPDGIQAFWSSQISAKSKIANMMSSAVFPFVTHAVIFGSWYGVLADMIKVRNVMCVDLESKYLNWCAEEHDTWQGSLVDFKYHGAYDHPGLVINTITEHISQDEYDAWYDNIPLGTTVILQGNNDFNEPDHIRPAKDLTEFLKMNKMRMGKEKSQDNYEGPWNHIDNEPTVYTRYTVMGKK